MAIPFDLLKTDYTRMKTEYEIAVNESFQIELDSNPTTGFAWKWTNKQSDSIIDTFDFEFIPGTPGLIGGGGKERWSFRGLSSGTATIKMEYCQSWDTKSTMESKEIIVRVK